MKPRKRTPGSAHSGERPKSAVTPIGFAAMGLNGRDETDVDDKISLEQFLKESNRSPKSRVSLLKFKKPKHFQAYNINDLARK